MVIFIMIIYDGMVEKMKKNKSFQIESILWKKVFSGYTSTFWKVLALEMHSYYLRRHHIDGKYFVQDFFRKPLKIVFLTLYLNECIYNKAYMMKKLGKVIRFNNWGQLLLIV